MHSSLDEIMANTALVATPKTERSKILWSEECPQIANLLVIVRDCVFSTCQVTLQLSKMLRRHLSLGLYAETVSSNVNPIFKSET